MCNEQLWSKLAPVLEDNYDLVHLPIPRYKSINELADYFNGMFFEPVNLLGFSLGGYLAAWFAWQYPEKVKRLFVVSNNLSELPPNEVALRKQIINWLKTHDYVGMSYQKAAKLLDDKNQSPELIGLIREMEKTLGKEEFISQNTYTTKRQNIPVASGPFVCPVRLFYSKNDPLMECQWLDEDVHALSGVKLHSATGCGHMLPLEQPEILAEYIKDWML